MVPSQVRTPPSFCGLHTSARAKREEGGKLSPCACGTSPVALQTAVISIADLLPSRKELNICKLILSGSSISRYWRKTSQTVSGVREWYSDR